MVVRIPNGLRTLLRQLGIDANATSIPEIGAESDSASATGSLYAQINKAQVDIGASTDTASASGSLFARAKFNKDAGDALAARATALETATKDVQTITLASVIPTDAVVVAGTTFTCVASGATGNEFNVGADDAATAVNLAAKITELEGITATSDAAVVTVTSTVPGAEVAITTSDTTLTIASVAGSVFAPINKAQVDIGASTDTASATGSLFARVAATKTVADGAAASLAVLAANTTDVQTITLDTVIPTDAVSVAGTTFTAVASGATGDQFDVGADDAETATNLAAKINALSGVSATADGAVVTVTADAPGVGIIITSGDTTMVVASASAANVFGILHALILGLADLDDRVTALE